MALMSRQEPLSVRKVYNVLHGFEGELDEQHQRGAKTGWRFDGQAWEKC
jgi:hypothetical protein